MVRNGTVSSRNHPLKNSRTALNETNSLGRVEEASRNALIFRTGLEPARAYELEVSILEQLDDASLIPADCPKHSYFPKLLERDDASLTFVQAFAGTPIFTVGPRGSQRLNRQICHLKRDFVMRFVRRGVT